MSLLSTYMRAFWDYIAITAPYLLFGLFASGILHEFLSLSRFSNFLKGTGIGPVLKASLVGIPLPLCSCSVIPAAATLKKKGASNGATSSFLISTPESGVDSMLITYALLDLPMTFIRPFAAFLTAVIAGIAQNLWNDFEGEHKEEQVKSCCSDKSSCGSEQVSPRKSFIDHSKDAFHYAFQDSSDDLAFWLFIGIALGALVNVIVPQELLYQSNSFLGRIILLLIGIPFYICASSSTPIAASMMMKGMSPGCALIFLLAGPATNFTNMAVLQFQIGKKGVLINILVIACVSLGLSYGVDYLYTYFQWPMNYSLVTHLHGEEASALTVLLGGILIYLMAKGIYKERIAKYFKSSKSSGCCS